MFITEKNCIWANRKTIPRDNHFSYLMHNFLGPPLCMCVWDTCSSQECNAVCVYTYPIQILCVCIYTHTYFLFKRKWLLYLTATENYIMNNLFMPNTFYTTIPNSYLVALLCYTNIYLTNSPELIFWHSPACCHYKQCCWQPPL